MHDQSFEQKLRTALQSEGDRLPFTITTAELERRASLRQRSGLGPMASLGLAAVVGIGLLGLVGVAGGWFERTSTVAPSPSPASVASVAPSSGPSPEPSGSVAGVLPSLDRMIEGHDAARIVRAAAVGPADGPAASEADLVRWSAFAPVTATGSYAVEIACLGSVDLQLQVVAANPGTPGRSWPSTCDGAPSSRLVDLQAGDGLGIFTSQAASWRIVVEAPARDALHATAIAEVTPPTDDVVLLDVNSETSTPEYAPAGTGGSMFVPAEYGTVQGRGVQRISLACAGPGTVRVAFAQNADLFATGSAIDDGYGAIQVECDGAIHRDVLELPPFDSAAVLVTAESRQAWHLIVSTDHPPIDVAPNGGGWTLSTAIGPDYFAELHEHGVSLVGPVGGGDVRVVVRCSGDATLDGTIDVGLGTRSSARLDPFTLDCRQDGAETLERSYSGTGEQVHVELDAHGGAIWLAVSAQVRDPASAAP